MRKLNVYVARVFSRHSGTERRVGIMAPNMKAAKRKAELDLGRVLSIERRKYYPSDVFIELSTLE